jgi:hypothetical protein
VLTDWGDGDKKKVRDLRDSELLEANHVLTADQLLDPSPTEADVEDLLGRAMYVHLVNVAFDLKSSAKVPTKKPTEAPIRVVKEVEAHCAKVGEPFNHFQPASYLIRHPDAFDAQAADALDAFERLFKTLNGFL